MTGASNPVVYRQTIPASRQKFPLLALQPRFLALQPRFSPYSPVSSPNSDTLSTFMILKTASRVADLPNFDWSATHTALRNLTAMVIESLFGELQKIAMEIMSGPLKIIDVKFGIRVSVTVSLESKI